MSSSIVSENDAGSSRALMTKKNRASELRHARKLIDNLQARRHEDGASSEDLSEFTEILSTVVSVLQSLEMEDNLDDSETATTLPETVTASIATTVDDLGSSCYGTIREEDGYEDDEEQQQLKRVLKREKRRIDERHHESFNDESIILDEDDEFAALSGYEEGFEPPADLDETTVSDSFVLGFETPTTRRTKATASISEESQCFYCQMHGNGEGCQGTRFCC